MSYRSRCFLGYIIPLGAVAFFNPLNIFSPIVSKIVYLLCWLSVFFIICLTLKKQKNKNYPKTGYTFLYIGFFSGYIVTIIVHKQGIFSISPIFQIFLAYSTLLLFFRLNLPKYSIFHIIKNLTVLGILVYLINRIFYPNTIFGSSIGDESRGMIRLAIPFIELQVLMFFYYLYDISKNGFLLNKNGKWCFLYGVIIMLSLTRQVIAAGYGLGLLLYLNKVSRTKKLIASLFVGLLVIFVVPSLPIYQGLQSATQEEADKTDGMENNSRIMAWAYYTYMAQESLITQIFGNGMPILERSSWGKKIDSETEWQGPGTGWHSTDVGWAGFYFYFGIFGVLGLLTIFYKACKDSKREHENWVSYWFIYIFITTFTSGAIIYTFQIIPITMVIYYTYANDRYNNTGIQQCKRYDKMYSICKGV